MYNMVAKGREKIQPTPLEQLILLYVIVFHLSQFCTSLPFGSQSCPLNPSSTLIFCSLYPLPGAIPLPPYFKFFFLIQSMKVPQLLTLTWTPGYTLIWRASEDQVLVENTLCVLKLYVSCFYEDFSNFSIYLITFQQHMFNTY